MESVVRTIYSAYLQTCKLRDSTFVLFPNSSLNQAFNIYPGEVSPTNETPSIKYLAIGNGGHSVAGDGSLLEVRHNPKHAALFSHLPFIARPVATDLSTLDMNKYRFKVLKNINGTDYYFYFLRALPVFAGNPSIVSLYTFNQNTIVSKYTSDPSNLAPIPISNQVIDVNTHSDYISVIDKLPFTFTSAELLELTTAYQLYYGKTDSPILSEIGIVSGVETTKVDVNGTTHLEAIEAQINYFVNTYYSTQVELTTAKEINTYIELGGMEPILNY